MRTNLLHDAAGSCSVAEVAIFVRTLNCNDRLRERHSRLVDLLLHPLLGVQVASFWCVRLQDQYFAGSPASLELVLEFTLER
jgi:hypothetical protein